MSSHPHPHGGFAPPERATEVSEGIFAYVQPDGSWWINNTGFLVGRTGVVSVDAATTLGPCLVTPEELEPFRSGKGFDLAMTASVNGRTYSTGNWNDLYWSFPQMLAYASRGTELRPGDVIGSGTVGTGCILELSRVHGHDAYPWLTAGDEVHLEIAGLGSITTCIAPATREPIPLV